MGRAGFEPATFCTSKKLLRKKFHQEDWKHFREWVFNRYSDSYAPTVICYAKQYYQLLYGNLAEVEKFSSSKKNAVLKALISLSKYLGVYRQFKDRMIDFGVKFEQPNSVDAFLRMTEAKHDVLDWVKEALDYLDETEGLFIKFKLLSGIRTGEAIDSFNMIGKLGPKDKLSEYYNDDLNSLEHFNFPEAFLRGTKNVFFTFIEHDTVEQITQCEPVSYESIRKKLWRKDLNMRTKELRSFWATFLVHHGLIREEVDLLQGRIGNSMFMQHYFSPEIQGLKERTLKAVKDISEKIT